VARAHTHTHTHTYACMETRRSATIPDEPQPPDAEFAIFFPVCSVAYTEQRGFPHSLGSFSLDRTHFISPGTLKIDPGSLNEWLKTGRAFTLGPAVLRSTPALQPLAQTLQGEAAKGHLSPLHPVNLSMDARKTAGIPENARFFAWSYPIDEPCEQGAHHAWAANADDPDVAFLSVGGYVYFGGTSSSDGNLDIICINALVPSAHGSFRLHFGPPQPFEPQWTAPLWTAKRFRAITLPQLSRSGATHFCWICPNEVFGGQLGSGGNSICKSGGFVYFFGARVIDEVAEATPQPEVAGTAVMAPVASPAVTTAAALVAAEAPVAEATPNIRVRTFNGAEASVEVSETDTIGCLKKQVQKHLGITATSQSLSFSTGCGDEMIVKHLEDEARDGATGMRQHDRTLQEFNLPEGATLYVTDFTKLRPQLESICRIPITAERAISVLQLESLLKYLQDQCNSDGTIFAWYEKEFRASASGTRETFYKKQVRYNAINLYQAVEWVLRPATYMEKCSYVELVSTDPTAQRPAWYVSHFWGEPIVDFVSCLKEHERLRKLPAESAYWVCAYSNNQHQLGSELLRNPKDTSFFHAIRISVGILLVLDHQGTAFNRAWCCYELAVLVSADDQQEREKEGGSRLLFDIATTDKGVAHLITDGPTLLDEEEAHDFCPQSKWGDPGDTPETKKCKRDVQFPEGVIKRASVIDVESSTASADVDKKRILNSIAGVDITCLDDNPPEGHESYKRTNCALRAIFAIVGWRSAVERSDHDMLESLGPDLLQDDGREDLTMSFTRCENFDDDKLKQFAAFLPPNLKKLNLRMVHTDISDVGVEALAASMAVLRDLQEVVLSLGGCGIADDATKALAAALAGKPHLESLTLMLGQTGVTDLGCEAMAEALVTAPRLQDLSLNLRRDYITDTGAQAIASSISKMPQLQALTLDFTRTHITTASAYAFAEALPAAHGVTKLTLKLAAAARHASDVVEQAVADRTMETLTLGH